MEIKSKARTKHSLPLEASYMYIYFNNQPAEIMASRFRNLYNRGTINRFNKHHYHNSKADICTRHRVAWRKNITKCKEETY